MNRTAQPATLLWLQSGGCGGCTMSLMCAESPDLLTRFARAGIQVVWHPALSEASGPEVMQLLESIEQEQTPLTFLCIEGALLCGPEGTGRFHLFGDTRTPFINWFRRLADKAEHIIAVGSCAAFGGATSAGPDPTDATGLQYKGAIDNGFLAPEFRSRSGLPVINIAGCPIHPDWVTEVLQGLAFGDFGHEDLDEFNRPVFYTQHLVHHGCPRNEYYEYKASAKEHSQLGCLMENLGCVATRARADCNIRPWNGNGSCTKGGYACINCTAPEFEEPGHLFQQTAKIAGIPVGLPTDMPKAWFVALSSLSKAATPERLSKNARSDHIEITPVRNSPTKTKPESSHD